MVNMEIVTFAVLMSVFLIFLGINVKCKSRIFGLWATFMMLIIAITLLLTGVQVQTGVSHSYNETVTGNTTVGVMNDTAIYTDIDTTESTNQPIFYMALLCLGIFFYMGYENVSNLYQGVKR